MLRIPGEGKQKGRGGRIILEGIIMPRLSHVYGIINPQVYEAQQNPSIQTKHERNYIYIINRLSTYGLGYTDVQSIVDIFCWKVLTLSVRSGQSLDADHVTHLYHSKEIQLISKVKITNRINRIQQIINPTQSEKDQ